MRRLGIGLVLAAAAAGQELDRDTLAGMDAEVRGDWVRAVEAFERRGWKWGGYWSNSDYQHFSTTGT